MEQRSLASDYARTKALSLVQQVGNEQKNIIESIRNLLIALSEVPDVRQADSRAASAFLANMIRRFTLYTNIGVVRPDGQIIASAVPFTQPVNYSDTKWFQQTIKSRKFTESAYRIGLITGIPTITYSRPILKENGEIKSIIYASLDIKWLTRLFEKEKLPAGSMITMFSQEGTILVRYPDTGEWVGKNMPDAPLIHNALLSQSEEGTFESKGLDGVVRLYAFKKLGARPEVGGYVTVGIPSSVAYAEVYKDFNRNLVILGLLILLITLASWWFSARFILNPVNRLLDTTRQLGKGDLTVRAGPPYVRGEIGQLALAFDQMTEALHIRESERQEAAENLKRQEEHFRSLIANTSDIILEINSDGTISYVSPAVESILNHKPEELIGAVLLDLVHPDDRENVFDRITQVLENPGKTYSEEFRLQHKDGSYYVLEGIGRSLPAEEKGRKIVVNARDITARLKAEKALRITKFSVDRAGDSIAWIGSDGRLVYVNDETCRSLGYSRDELLSMTIFAINPELQKEGWDKHWEEAKQRGSLTTESRHRTKEGIFIPVEIKYNYLEYDNDEYNVAFIRDISERLKSEEELKTQLDRLAALRAIDMAITASLDLRVTFQVFLDQVTSQLGVDAADILLMDPHTNRLEYTAGRGFRTAALKHTRLALGEGLAGQAAMEGRVVSISNLSEAKEYFERSPLFDKEDFIAYFGVPLIAKGKVQGVLEVFHRSPLDPEPEWLDFLDSLAGQAAIAIDNSTLFTDLQKSNIDLVQAYDTTLEGWSRALDLRDKETEGHSQRVTDMTVRVARAMGVGNSELIHLRRGALLHDIGKMGIPDHILLKPGPLNEEEWEIMHKHPINAYELLYPIAYLRPALEIPYGHHEKWDGTGYPRGLKGEQIPLAARIFAVVDVWDALRSDRPYRPGWSDEKAIEHIRQEAGKHFDPKVVDVFLATVFEKGQQNQNSAGAGDPDFNEV
ncbi:MAG: PAS domain S-box protein [Candidatus Desulfaltia sp.]|nr:PAS domain S-box protein [Candidatus Desulfaltia sp.]